MGTGTAAIGVVLPMDAMARFDWLKNECHWHHLLKKIVVRLVIETL